MPRLTKDNEEFLAKVLAGILLFGLPLYLCSGLGTSSSDESLRDKKVAPASQDDFFTPKMKKDIEVAKLFEKLLFLSSHDAKRFILFVDIHQDDGHLMLYCRDRMFLSSEESQNEVYSTILQLWKDSKYVREQNYAGWMEVRNEDAHKLREIR